MRHLRNFWTVYSTLRLGNGWSRRQAAYIAWCWMVYGRPPR